MLREELLRLLNRADMIMQEINDAIEVCEKIDVPIQNIISVLTAAHEFNKLLNEFTETHSRNGSFTI